MLPLLSRRLLAVSRHRAAFPRSTTQRIVGASVLVAAVASLPLIAISACEEPEPTIEELQKGWDDFYTASIKPGEDDEDDDEEDEDEEEEEESGNSTEEEEPDAAGTETVEGESGKNLVESLTSEEKGAKGVDSTDNENKNGSHDEDESPTPASTAEMSSDKARSTVSTLDEDKYENLPDEDEPTSCSICRINRQGACRAFWRKFEVCMKDNMQDESSDVSPTSSVALKCDKYMLPWIACFQEYRNFYTLATNALYRFDYLDGAEATVPKDQQRTLEDPDIDWTGYLKVIEESKMTLVDFVVAKRAVEVGKDARKLDDLREDMKLMGLEYKEEVLLGSSNVDNPKYLCDCKARVALKDPETQLPIEVAYARDQDGNVLGFDMFSSAKEEQKEDSGVMTFSVRFGATQTVTICAIYQENQADDRRAHVSMEKRLYKSKPVSVFRPMKEAGLLKDEKAIPLPSSLSELRK